METTESCKQCEKIELHLELQNPVSNLLELPNTYQQREEIYGWKHTDILGYALIPRVVKGTNATVDYYLCVDEDILDDIDVYGYATKLFSEDIQPRWANVKNVQFVEPLLSSSEDLPCWKYRHNGVGEEDTVIPMIQE